MEPRWLVRAREFNGTREIPGKGNNPQILEWWSLIRAPFTDDATPWCAGFVGGVLEECGIKSSRSAAARSYEKWGRGLAKPVIGCVVVFSRKGGGHVGFYVGETRTHILVLGGNQSDMVNVSRYPKSGGSLKITGYRWPLGEPMTVTAPKDEEAQDGGRVTLYGQPDDPGVEHEERPGFFKRMWLKLTGGVGGVGALTYLNGWEVTAVIVIGLLIFTILVTAFLMWLFGAERVRMWIRKQVS
jgi:uncharacterized protein (TIGR02594 family)